MSETINRLVEEVVVVCADPRYERLKRMWTRHNRLEKVNKIPVCVLFRPGYPQVWKELIPEAQLVSNDPLEREIEIQLRQKLFRYYHIPDDAVVMPTVWLSPVRPPGDDRLWGVPLERQRVEGLEDTLGAYRHEPGLRSEEDLTRLHHPKFQVDEAATRSLVDRATELVGGRVPIKLIVNELGQSPPETVVALLGMERYLYAFIDEPALLHRLMDLVTDGYIAYHRAMEQSGMLDVEWSWHYQVQYEHLPEGVPSNKLSSYWGFIAADSTSGISPAMYAEFIQPYHERLARILGENRVYYHNCANVTNQIDIISRLPNLRRFHISPWTSLETAVEKLGRRFVLETRVSNAATVLHADRSQWVRDLKRIVDVAGDCIVEINLSDFVTVRNDPSIVTQWALTAQAATSDA